MLTVILMGLKTRNEEILEDWRWQLCIRALHSWFAFVLCIRFTFVLCIRALHSYVLHSCPAFVFCIHAVHPCPAFVPCIHALKSNKNNWAYYGGSEDGFEPIFAVKIIEQTSLGPVIIQCTWWRSRVYQLIPEKRWKVTMHVQEPLWPFDWWLFD